MSNNWNFAILLAVSLFKTLNSNELIDTKYILESGKIPVALQTIFKLQ